MATFQTPVRRAAFPVSGKMGMAFISGSRKTISCRDCSSQFATPCVTANHGALVELMHGRTVWIGFDQLCGRPHNWSYVTNVVMWRSAQIGTGI
jgi:hypothetical protein